MSGVPGGSSTAPGFSVTTGRESMTSYTRITLARASWPMVIRLVSARTGATICPMYRENARKTPSVI